MRRRLAGLRSLEVLQRPRKAPVNRGLVNALTAAWSRLGGGKKSVLEELGVANGAMLSESVSGRRAGTGRFHYFIVANLDARTLVARFCRADRDWQNLPGNHAQQAGTGGHARGRTHDFLGREKLNRERAVTNHDLRKT